MPPRKAAKHHGVTTSREALPSTDDDEDHDERESEWIKATTRTVHTDVQAKSRNRKKTRFEEEDEEVEVLSTPLDIFSDIGQNQHFSAWLDSSEQDNVFDDYGDYGNDGEHDSANQPSGRNSRMNFDDTSDTSSVDSKDDADSPVHDLSDFAAEEVKVCLFEFSFFPMLACCFTQAKILLDWVPLRDSLLDELTRLDGVKNQMDCADCGASFDNDEDHKYRCGDCLDSIYRCKACILDSHADKPLHRIYVSLIIF